jgi:hypothetical protein
VEYIINKIMEKHAGAISKWWGELGPVKNYREIAKKPSFRAKKIVGTAALATLPVMYAAHQLTKGPQPMQEPPQSPETSRYNMM